jgi:hypothetical protein
VREGVALLCAVLAIAGCSANGPAVAHSSPSAKITPSPTPSPSPIESPTPPPSPSPSAPATPVAVPAWAALRADCSGAAAAQEAVLRLQGQNSLIIADVTDAKVPRNICGIAGDARLTPQLVTQTMISWYATQNGTGTPGPSVIAVLDLATGTSTVAASWQGGGFMDGLHAWSPDRGFLAYVTSDATAVNLHLLSGGGDRVVATMGAVPGRGVNPNEDDAYLSFSPDGAYFAFVQTFTSSGDQLQVRRTTDGSIAYSLPTGTMATWGSTGSRLYFRQASSGVVDVWDSTTGVSQAFGQLLSWIQPRADAGDDNLAFTVRSASGLPHVWLYGHSGRSGGELSNIRSSAVWINSTSLFYVEEAACTSNCGLGASWQPDGKTFTFDLGTQSETASKISAVYGAWPRPGQT